MWWTAENEWFAGRVVDHHANGRTGTTIFYDDGETHVHEMTEETWKLEPPSSAAAARPPPRVGDSVRIWWKAQNKFLPGRVVRRHPSAGPLCVSVRYHRAFLTEVDSTTIFCTSAGVSDSATPFCEIQHDTGHERVEVLDARNKLTRLMRASSDMAVPAAVPNGGRRRRRSNALLVAGAAAAAGGAKRNHEPNAATSPTSSAVDSGRRRARGGRRRSRTSLPAEKMRSLLDEVFSRVLLTSQHTLRCLAVPVNRAQFPDYFDKVKQPIDLRTMREWLRRAKAPNLNREELLALLTRMVDNSIT